MMTSRDLGSILFLLPALWIADCGGSQSVDRALVATPTASAPVSMPPPTWLGPYDGEQMKLLAMPLEGPVEVPAPKVYPDLSRFTYTGEALVKVPGDLIGYADLVGQTLDQSPYLYVFRNGDVSLANTTALWGPAPDPEPDLWKRAVPNAGGQPALEPAVPDVAGREALEKARGAAPAQALEGLRQAAAAAGQCPGMHASAGDAAILAGDLAAAESEANEALKIDPLFPAAYRILAEVRLRRGDREGAKSSLTKALALYPPSKRAWALVDAILGREVVRDIGLPPPFIEVNAAGAVIVVSCDRPLCEHYAGCKAAFRYEPGLREAVLNEKPGVPYHLSVTEEVVCLEAGLGAHLQARGAKEGPPRPDPRAELLLRLAQSKGLTGYAMFEIIGTHRPEWLRVAPGPAHEAVVAYVTTRVFGSPTEGAPPAPASSGVLASSVGPPPRWMAQ